MSEPDLIHQQRDILRRFRMANHQRTKAESTAAHRYKAERANADTALSQTQQTAKAQFTTSIAEAEIRHKTERDAADALLDKVRKIARDRLTRARDAHTQAQAALNQVKLRHLLEQASSTSPILDHNVSAAQKLDHSFSLAVESAQSISATVVALKEQQRIAATRRQALLWFALALLVVGVVWGFSKYQAQQTHYAQATAIAVAQVTATAVVQAQVTAEAQARVTATALAPQAQATAIALGLEPTHVRINPVDGAIYVLVPAGEFTMGSPTGVGSNDEHPQTKVILPAFWIMRTEVTNAQYKLCVDVGKCTKPDNAYWDKSENGNAPVTDVDWDQARAYAAWVGGRLPTEAEWEKAACGTDGRAYPWGNTEPNDQRLNYNNKGGHTSTVGSYPSGASPYGALDMAGNVWEWTSSQYLPYPYRNDDGRENAEGGDRRVLRGGSLRDDRDVVRCAYRFWRGRNSEFNFVGLRVAVFFSF